MTDQELENIIFDALVSNEQGEGLGFLNKTFKRLRKKAKKIVRQVKKNVGNVGVVAAGFAAGGPVGASVAAAGVYAQRLNRKQMERANKRAGSPNPGVLMDAYMSEQGVEFESERPRRAMMTYVNERVGSQSMVRRFGPWVIGAVAIVSTWVVLSKRNV